MRAAHRAGVPYMVSPQGSFHPWALARNGLAKRVYRTLLEGPLLGRASRLQALTSREAEQFRDAGLEAPSVVIPNGVDTDALAGTAPPLSRRLGLPEGERTLLFLSRVHPKKGLDLLLHAFREVRREFPVTLVVAGADAGSGYLPEMRRLSRELGVADHCRFLGEVQGSEKVEILLGADACALLSRSEGHPVAVLEALGAGRPTVLTTECNLPEVAEADAGWIVPPDAGAGARALLELFRDPDRAVLRGGRARRLVAGRFGWEGIAGLTLEAYEAMLAEARAKAGRN
jgi:glycosyltransferase involved in cell wall biosynthesis